MIKFNALNKEFNNQQLINNYYKLLKEMGYLYSNTSMGCEWNKDTKKFSIIQIGDLFDTFYNKKIDNIYQLQDRLLGQFSLVICLEWIFKHSK